MSYSLKSINEEWQGFAASVLPKDAPQIQRDEMRMAFMAGAWLMVAAVERIGEPDITEAEGMQFLTATKEECQHFKKEYMARYSEKN